MYSRTILRSKDSIWVRVISILLFTTLTALSARFRAVLPYSPVPLTLQVLVVVLSGFVLGAQDALWAQLLYLQAILLGAPLTAMGIGGPLALASPTAGYLISFPIAAAAAGWLSQRGEGRKLIWRSLGGLAALAIIYTVGTSWLSVFVGNLADAWRLGAAPFVLADTLKIAIAVAGLSLRKR